MDENEWKIGINKRLEVVINLLFRMVQNEGGMNLREQITVMSELGLRPKEIAEILGRSQPYVNKELVGIRKYKTKKNGNRIT